MKKGWSPPDKNKYHCLPLNGRYPIVSPNQFTHILTMRLLAFLYKLHMKSQRSINIFHVQKFAEQHCPYKPLKI